METNIKKLTVAILLALVPAFVAYILFGIAAGAVTISAILFLGIWIGLSYSYYQKENIKEQASSMFFVLSIEMLLTPLVFLIYTFVFASGQTTGAAEATGAAIGGAILVAIAFFIGLPLAAVFYLISKRIG